MLYHQRWSLEQVHILNMFTTVYKWPCCEKPLQQRPPSLKDQIALVVLSFGYPSRMTDYLFSETVLDKHPTMHVCTEPPHSVAYWTNIPQCKFVQNLYCVLCKPSHIASPYRTSPLYVLHKSYICRYRTSPLCTRNIITH